FLPAYYKFHRVVARGQKDRAASGAGRAACTVRSELDVRSKFRTRPHTHIGRLLAFYVPRHAIESDVLCAIESSDRLSRAVLDPDAHVACWRCLEVVTDRCSVKRVLSRR